MGAVASGVGEPLAMTHEQRFGAALAALAGALGELQRPWMLIGGLAVIARGYPRHTDDVDATVWAPGVTVDQALRALERHDIQPRAADAKAFADRAQILLVRHEPSGLKVDISLAWLPFEEEALGRATPVEIGGVQIPTALAEDLVVYKFVAWRERDRTDIERLLLLHGAAIDLSRVRRWVQEFAEALEEPERVPAFEELVRRAREPGLP